jgi:hypothetical protein
MIEAHRTVRLETPINGGDEAEPAARRPIVSGHSHDTGIVPQAAIHDLRKRQPTMPCDDAIAPCQFQIALLDERRRGAEYELIDLPNASMDDREKASVEFEVNPSRQLRKPTPSVCVDLGAGIGKPARRQLLTGTSGREPASAVIGAEGQLFIAIAHDDSYAGCADEIDCGRRVAAIGGQVPGADRRRNRRRESLPCGARQHGFRAGINNFTYGVSAQPGTS